MDDLISRQAAIDTVHKTVYGFFDIAGDESEAPISDKDKLLLEINKAIGNGLKELTVIERQPTADVRDNATAHKVVGGGERDGATCWFECDCCGLAVDIGDVFCKHCGARFVP